MDVKLGAGHTTHYRGVFAHNQDGCWVALGRLELARTRSALLRDRHSPRSTSGSTLIPYAAPPQPDHAQCKRSALLLRSRCSLGVCDIILRDVTLATPPDLTLTDADSRRQTPPTSSAASIKNTNGAEPPFQEQFSAIALTACALLRATLHVLKCGITSEANISMLRLVNSSERVPNWSIVTRLLTPVRSTISLIF